MALENFGWFVPKVASGPKPHPEEAVGSPMQILHSHLSHCYLFLLPSLLCHMINPKRLAGLEGPTQGTGSSSSHPREQGSVGPSAWTWL